MPTYTIQTPEGRKLKIEAADEATALRGAQDWSRQNGGTKAKRSLLDDATGAMANFNRGLGIGDELAAGGQAAMNVLSGKASLSDIPGAYKNALAQQRQYEDSYVGEHPVAGNLLRGTGMAASSAVPVGTSANVLANGGRAINALRGAVTGGITAAGFAAADRGTAEERLRNASSASTNPLALGLGALGGALATPRAPKPQAAPKVDLDQLRVDKQAAYRRADDVGATYSPEAVQDLTRAITDEARAAGINPTRHPKATSMLRDIQKWRGRTPSLTQLDQLRQVIRRDVANSPDRAEAFFGQAMIRNIDDFVDAAGPAQMATGDAEVAAQAINQARAANSRYRKVETVQNAIESGDLGAASSGSGGNVNNATRQKLRPLLDPQSGRRIKNLTPDEEAALDTAIRGTPGQNLARQVGKLSPEGNGLMQGLHLAAAVPSGGLSGVAAIAGAVSKRIADRGTAQNVERLLQIMASGGQDASVAQGELSRLVATNPQVRAAYQEFSAQLSRAAGVGAGDSVSAGQR